MDRARYVPAIDGARAVAVVAVLLFHADLGVAPGGFLGVSLFFTISGYLITSLLLREHEATGTISLRGFFARRWRRLTPTAWIAVAGVLGASVWWSASQRAHLPGDALASLGQVANWRFAFAEQTYQELFIGRPSPLAHYWSLAIEEQFYVVVALVAVVALRWGRRALAVAAGLLLAGSVLATFLTSDHNLIYNGTHTRAAEILAGVLLALVPRAWLDRATVRWAGTLAGLGFVALVVVTHVDSAWVYEGGLIGVAAVSTLLVAALVGAPRSLLVRTLSLRPLVVVGTWSYALYLVHWPIFLLLDSDRVGVGGVSLFAVRVAVSMMLAGAITHVIERPIRERRLLGTPRRAAVATALASAALIVAVTVVPGPNYDENEALLAAGSGGSVDFEQGSDPIEVVPSPSTSAAPPPPVLVVGSDPVLASRLREAGVDVIDRSDPACPITPAVAVRLRNGSVRDTSGCPDAAIAWPAEVAELGPRAVVVGFGPVDAGVVRAATDDGFPAADDLTGIGERWDRVEAALDRVRDRLDPALPLHLVRRGVADDDLQLVLDRFALADPSARPLTRSLDSLVAELDTSAAATEALRVLVIGDSTSLFVATALHRAGAGSLDVVWMGEYGCPFVDVEALRSSPRDPRVPTDCTSFLDLVPPKLDEIRPDVVLLVVSGVELREQRYAGDPAAHVPGDPVYTATHDEFMAKFVAPLADRGVTLLVADSPPLQPSSFLSVEAAQPARVQAFNDQVQRWADSSPWIERFPYAAAVVQREAEVGSIRSDGIHPDVKKLTALAADVLVPELVRLAATKDDLLSRNSGG